MMRALLAGDLPATAVPLAEGLRACGIGVLACALDEVVAAVRYDEIDAVVLDPARDEAWRVVQALRAARCEVGLVFLTGDDPDLDAVEAWLDVGDDLLINFVHPREIAAHLRAVDRRRQGQASALMTVRGLTVHHRERLAEFEGRPLPLRRCEWRLLTILVRRAGRLTSKESLLYRLQESDEPPDLKLIDVLVCTLRRVLRTAGAPADLIETVRGDGYLIRKAAPARRLAA